MSYSESFPSQRPIFTLDAANAGRLDSRISYSRSTTGTYFGTEKVLGSENLLTYSNPNNAAWDESNNATIGTNATAAPDGTTTASTITEDTATGVNHRVFLSPGNSANGQTYTFVGYFKANGRTFVGPQLNGSGITTTRVEFELSGSGTATSRAGSPANLSISQIGATGWYKCSFQATASGSATLYLNIYLQDGANSLAYNGDGASGVYAWGCSVSTTGQLVHEDTSGQIAREYQTKLQTAAINAPRFEYSPTDSASMGLLIEQSSTNLNPYSDDISSWSLNTRITTTSNAAVGPDGTLGADLIVGTGSSSHYARSAAITVSSGATYTLSGYFKSLNGEKVRLLFYQTGSPYTHEAGSVFTLTGNGSVETADGTATITPVGNGYYRCTVTGTTLSTSSFIQVQTYSTDGSQTYVANDYNGILCAGIQFELGSFASSLISTTGSAATRAADSASMDLTQAGFNGGPFTVVSETEGGQGSSPRAFSISDGTGTNRLSVFRNSSTATASTQFSFFEFADGVNHVSSNIGNSSVSNVKLAFSVDTDDLSWVANGGTVATDTSVVLPKVDKLFIGMNSIGSATSNLNGHCKRVAVYSEALTDTNLQALTS